jgi:hypothetical protein
MPARKARPRARARRLEGIDRLAAMNETACFPSLWGDEIQWRQTVRELVEMWQEVRLDAIAEGWRLDENWCFQVLERGESPVSEDVWGFTPDEQGRVAGMARELFAP